MSTSMVVFNADVAKYPGGERYAQGLPYYLDHREACLWAKRGAAHTVEPAYLTPEAVAENAKNLRPGRELDLADIVKALADLGGA